MPATNFQLSHDLRVRKHYCSHGHFDLHKNVLSKGRIKLSIFSLSSDSMRQDAWSLHLSDTIYKPLCCVPSRCNLFVCRSFFTPGQANEISLLKAAVEALTRSYGYLHGRPLAFQLASAFGMIAFAIWGLGPLMRHTRSWFLHRNDSSWRKSTTYYVLVSYVHPILLWTGVMLICRVLEPVVLPSETSQTIKQRLLNFSRSLSTVLAFAHCLSSLIQWAQKCFTETNDSHDARNMGLHFTGKALYTAVWVAALSFFMELLGFSTQKWITAGGLGTVLITLAGREILTNFLSSIMIHATRPFVVNEWIQTKIEGYEVSGTVEHVGWWSPTIVRGDDREAIHIPNHKFTINIVRNLSQKTHWRIKAYFAISHFDANKINFIVADMRKVLAKSPQIDQQRLHRRVFLDNIDPENQALMILVSCFVKTSHIEEYLCVKESILLDLLRVVNHHRARLATPIRTVQKTYADRDMENVPFSDATFTRSRSAANRQFLLIEPPSRINRDGKAEGSLGSAHSGEAAALKSAVAPDSKSEMTSKHSEDIKNATAEDVGFKGSNDGSSAPGEVSTQTSAVQIEGPAGSELAPSSSQETTSEGSGNTLTSAASHSNHGGGKTPHSRFSNARPVLEENIILGVALEGSKRTLPIEEGKSPSPNPGEMDLAARKNPNLLPPAGKEEPVSAARGAVAGDPPDQEK